MLSERLERYGRDTQLFYAWLIQYDLITDEFQQLALAVIGTDAWRYAYQIAGRTPDELALDTVFDMASRFYWSVPKVSVPLPLQSSVWQPFVLDEGAYLQAIESLDGLLHSIVESESMEARF